MSEADFSYPLPTDTAHVNLESRQYRLFKFDLGEGVPRQKLLIGVLILVPWFILLAIIGVGFLAMSWLYLIPPSLVIWSALRVDEGGRPRYALWLDRGRFILRRHVPLINVPGATAKPRRAFIAHAEWLVLDIDQIEKRRRKAR